MSIDNNYKNNNKYISPIFSRSVKNLDSNKLNNYKQYSSLNTEYNKSDLRNKIKITNDYNKACVDSSRNNSIYSKEKMDYLKKLSMKTSINNEKINKHRHTIEDEEEAIKKIKQINSVVINGKYYNKNDIATISNAVLKECNYIKKSFDNEKAGDSKTMITRGMTVNEFTEKYHLPK